MRIKIYKAMAGQSNTKKPLELEFESFKDAEDYISENILPNETLYKCITYKVKNLGPIKLLREYMFLDDEDFHLYSYRIIQD